MTRLLTPCRSLLVAATLLLSTFSFAQTTLVGQWTFEPGQELVDQTGNFNDLVLNGATVSNGQLDVGINAFARGIGYSGPTLTEKTLVAWVSLDALTTSGAFSGGSALTIDKVNVDNFDAIVFGERQANRWMAGSNFFQRTQDLVPGFAESTTGQLVQIAICYKASPTNTTMVEVFRDGVSIGSYTKGALLSYLPGMNTEVLFGLRHTPPNGSTPGRPWLDAKIEEARIYQGCLTGADLQALTVGTGPMALVAPSNLAADNSTALLVPLSWDDNSSDEDGFQICRDGVTIATVGPDVTSYDDTVEIFGTPLTYEVKAIRGTDISDPSNTAVYSMPANIALLELTYVCYNSTTDSLTWQVENPNAQGHPFVFAQFWSTQRDTLIASPGFSTFKTKKNSSSVALFGDPNITGIWWKDETLTVGSPSSIVFRANRSVSCSGARFAFAPLAKKTSGFFTKSQDQISFERGIKDAFANAEIAIGPNPVTSSLHIDLGQLGSESQLNIMNMMGQRVKSEIVDLSQPQSVDVSDLPAGVYMVEMRVYGVSISRKIIKE